jgi:hypothetical protein
VQPAGRDPVLDGLGAEADGEELPARNEVVLTSGEPPNGAEVRNSLLAAELGVVVELADHDAAVGRGVQAELAEDALVERRRDDLRA